MPSFGKQSLERLKTLDPRLQEILLEAIKYADFMILEGHREKDRQNQLFAEGKSKVKWPNSKHNTSPSIAVDVAPWPIDWNNTARFYILVGFIKGIAASKGISLRLGADWDGDFDTRDNKFNDLPHIEILE